MPMIDTAARKARALPRATADLHLDVLAGRDRAEHGSSARRHQPLAGATRVHRDRAGASAPPRGFIFEFFPAGRAFDKTTRMKSQTVHVLDPTAACAADLREPVPQLETLRGRTLGIRVDRTWVSFQRFADFLEEVAAERWGVARVVRFDPGVRTGTSEEERRKVAGFVRAVDAAVVGLGT